ncbi:MAG: hypothetical protein WBW53_12995 [Terriglobales bacterium]
MKLVGVISTAVLSLALGVAVPAFAQEQHDQDEQKAKPAAQQEEKKAQPEKSARQDEKPAAEQEKNAKQVGEEFKTRRKELEAGRENRPGEPHAANETRAAGAACIRQH